MEAILIILVGILSILIITVMFAKGLSVDFLWFKFDKDSKSTWNRDSLVPAGKKRSLIEKWGSV